MECGQFLSAQRAGVILLNGKCYVRNSRLNITQGFLMKRIPQIKDVKEHGGR